MRILVRILCSVVFVLSLMIVIVLGVFVLPTIIPALALGDIQPEKAAYAANSLGVHIWISSLVIFAFSILGLKLTGKRNACWDYRKIRYRR